VGRVVVACICVCAAFLGAAAGYLTFGSLRAADLGLPAEYGGEVYLPVVEEVEVEAEAQPEYLYFVTVEHGRIVVYSAQAAKQGREITSIIISALCTEEQARLQDGIRIYSEEALVRLLEDYGS